MMIWASMANRKIGICDSAGISNKDVKGVQKLHGEWDTPRQSPTLNVVIASLRLQ